MCRKDWMPQAERLLDDRPVAGGGFFCTRLGTGSQESERVGRRVGPPRAGAPAPRC